MFGTDVTIREIVVSTNGHHWFASNEYEALLSHYRYLVSLDMIRTSSTSSLEAVNSYQFIEHDEKTNMGSFISIASVQER